MEDCAQQHEVCRGLGTMDSTDRLPTRLIDCSDPHRVRIIETKGKMDGARYVALSYVWGTGSQAHRTTIANLSTRTRDGIATETLPQTIRDAIYVTRTLGFRFLWLDSLCIIQDSLEDKHREVASMARIYRHAYLTIDAASAASVEEGFLQDRRSSQRRDAAFFPFICPANPRDGAGETEVRMGNLCFTSIREVEEGPGSRVDHGCDSDDEEELKNETGRRGWCMQEILLSTRSLVFGENTLSVKCQTHPSAHHVGLDWGLYDVRGLYDVIPVSPDSGKWKKTRIHERWREIVQDYTERLLSFPPDKLLACAAISEVFAPHLGPHYLAGLWRSTLLLDLLWHTFGHPLARPREYPHAPSWSWASTNRRVTFLTGVSVTLQPMAEAVNHSITLQDSILRFGPVQPGGYLVFRAALLPCKWNGNVGKIEYQQLAFRFGCTYPFPGLCYFDDDADLQDVFLMPLGHRKDKSYSVFEDRVYGLLVAQAEWSIRQSAQSYHQSQFYQKVGVWSYGVSPVWRRRSDDAEGLSDFNAFLCMCQDVPKAEIVLV
ncbi:heterokaryon incompatibility protein-domain-containing protein [Cubamyces menziesii]|nr:heterokaryon incompatibility protein-domain-containing protein [Cubamyces menziesii]